MIKLTKDQLDLLTWLSREDVSAYGECHGAALDSLVALGIADVEPYGPGLAHGYGRVTLTDYGWELLNDMQTDAREAAETASMSWSD